MINVLCIDDECNTEKMRSKFELLEDEGIHIIPIVYIKDALPAIRINIDKIQMILLDVIMPPLGVYSLEYTNGGTSTGIQLLQDIRNEFKTIPIMLVSINNKSHYASEDIIFKYKNIKYIQKPISASLLAEEIRNALLK
jgi:DNA-binding NtrC family response regulator